MTQNNGYKLEINCNSLCLNTGENFMKKILLTSFILSLYFSDAFAENYSENAWIMQSCPRGAISSFTIKKGIAVGSFVSKNLESLGKTKYNCSTTICTYTQLYEKSGVYKSHALTTEKGIINHSARCR